MCINLNNTGITKVVYQNDKMHKVMFGQNNIFERRRCSCKEWLIDGYNTSGVYTIYPDENPIDVYCDQVTDGGGWTAVLKNHGGPNGTGIAMQNLWTNTDSEHNKTVIPFSAGGVLESTKTPIMYDYFKNLKNIEILKTIDGYYSDGSAVHTGVYPKIVPATNILDTGPNVSYNDIITASDSQKLLNQVELFINDQSYGKTDTMMIAYNNSSIGFANAENDDDRGQPASNLMNGWMARHFIAYTDQPGRDAIRCQPICWTGDETYKIEMVLYYREK
jgi:hypothetical protein